MDKIYIKDTRYADSRTGANIIRDTLYHDTVEHIKDVQMGMCFFADMMISAGEKHDWTKMDNFDEDFCALVLSEHTDEEFKASDWYERHIYTERHHVNHDAKSDVNLIDIFEHIADVVMAGNGRSGHISSKYCDINPLLLYRAYWNTIRMLDDVVEVKKDE